MWEDLAGPVLSGAALLWIGHRVTRGGRRWRTLALARHELEVAGLIQLDQDLAERLHSSAHLRVERYLAPRGLETAEGKARLWAFVLATGATLILLGQTLNLLETDGRPFAAQMALGLGGAVAWHALYWVLQPGLVRAIRARD